ncbi:MAG: hypothetical protein LIP77_03970 [Planctomycetes bacterium]|nr:hypothetical protein [Planctomycetota bacterium]
MKVPPLSTDNHKGTGKVFALSGLAPVSATVVPFPHGFGSIRPGKDKYVLGEMMNERDNRRQELMRELAERFRSSSEIMRLIARRIGEAAETHNANRRRLEDASRPLRRCVETKNGTMPFSYREFLEFSSADEFERFRDQAAITDADLAAIDWEALARGLLET